MAAAAHLLSSFGVSTSCINRLALAGFNSTEAILTLNEHILRSYSVPCAARKKILAHIIEQKSIFVYELYSQGFALGVTGKFYKYRFRLYVALNLMIYT